MSQLPSPRRRRRHRNRYASLSPWRTLALPVLIVAAGATLVAATIGGGCSVPPGAAVAAPFLSPQQRVERIDDELNAAVDSLNRGQTAAADAALHRAVALFDSGDDSDTGGGRAEVAREMVQRGRPEAAARLLEEGTKDETQAWNPLLWATLADAAGRAGDADRAARAQKEAAKRAEELSRAVSTATVKPDSPQAREQAERAMQLGTYFANYGGDVTKATDAYRLALRAMPGNPIILNTLGYTLADQGSTSAQYSEAVELTRKAVEIAPESPEIRDSYGWALYKRGDATKKDLEGARRVLREAADDLPYRPEIRYHLGVVYAALGLNHEASLELDRALVLQPDSKAAREALLRLPAPYNALPTEVTTEVSPTPAPSPSPIASPGASPVPVAAG